MDECALRKIIEEIEKNSGRRFQSDYLVKAINCEKSYFSKILKGEKNIPLPLILALWQEFGEYIEADVMLNLLLLNYTAPTSTLQHAWLLNLKERRAKGARKQFYSAAKFKKAFTKKRS